MGLRVFGSEVFKRTDPGACEDSELVVKPGTGNRDDLLEGIKEDKPYGETPIPHALHQAAQDLGDEGARSIVLVSDGESTCDPSPCDVAKELTKDGIDLKIDVVGLSAKVRKQLKCIAEEGNGTYYDADSAQDVVDKLDRVPTQQGSEYDDAGGADCSPAGEYVITIERNDVAGGVAMPIGLRITEEPEIADAYGRFPPQVFVRVYSPTWAPVLFESPTDYPFTRSSGAQPEDHSSPQPLLKWAAVCRRGTRSGVNYTHAGWHVLHRYSAAVADALTSQTSASRSGTDSAESGDSDSSSAAGSESDDDCVGTLTLVGGVAAIITGAFLLRRRR